MSTARRTAACLAVGSELLGDRRLDSNSLTITHALWGLVGWVGLLIVGVSFHLIPMFYVTPPIEADRANHIVDLIKISLVLTPLLLLLNLGALSFFAGMAPAVGGMILYLHWLFTVLGQRRRKRIDSVIRGWWIGGLYLGASLVALFPLLLLGQQQWYFLVGGFFILGFALNITLVMLFKIFSFLVWFHRFSNLIGQANVPMLGDLITEKDQYKITTSLNLWLACFFVALLFGEQWLIQLLGVGLILIAANLGRLLYKADFYQIKN